MRTLARAYDIIVREGRVPGRLLTQYYGILERLGVREMTLKTKNDLQVTCMTNARVVFTEVFEKDEYAIDGVDYAGKTVVDVGANQGFFSLYAASRGARVYAFEPVAENANMFRRNVEQNGLSDRVTLFEAAVTSGETEVTLFVGFNKLGNPRSETASIVNDQRGGTTVEERTVRGIPIADLPSVCGVDEFDIMKFDCEGAEVEIFKTMPDDLVNCPMAFVVEYHHHESAGILSRLREAGFKIIHQDSTETGLIKAVR